MHDSIVWVLCFPKKHLIKVILACLPIMPLCSTFRTDLYRLQDKNFSLSRQLCFAGNSIRVFRVCRFVLLGIIIPRQVYQHVQYDEVHRTKHRARATDLLSDPSVPGFAAPALPGSDSILPIRAHRLYAQRNLLRCIALPRRRSIVVVTLQVPAVLAEIAAPLPSGAYVGAASSLLDFLS